MKIKVFLLYIFEFLRDGYYVGIFLLLPFIEKDIHLSLFQAGSLQTTVNLLIVLLALPVVSLLIRFGEIRLLILSLFLYAIGFTGIFFANSYIFLFFIFVIIGIAFSIYATISSHIRVTWFNKEVRGKELGNLMAIGDVAKVLFSSITGLVAGLIGWRVASISIGVITGLIFFVCSFIFSKKISNIKNDQIKSKKTQQYLPHTYFFKQKRFILAVIAGSLDEGVNAPFYVFLPFLFLYKGIPIVFVGMFTGAYYVGNIVSRLLFGRLVDKIGSAKTLIILELSMALMTFFIAFSSSIIIVGILALVLGFVTEGTDPATTAMLAESLERVENIERSSGIQTISKGTLKALFPFILGFIATKMGIVWGFYALAFACLFPVIPAWLFMLYSTYD